MRCKKHLSDPSSAVGVCATCLRERLLAVVDSQSQPLPLPPPEDGDRRDCEPKPPPYHLPPPPLVLPRSVSPYISRRKSDTGIGTGTATDFSDGRKQMFFSTPQAGPIASKTKKKSKFRLFSSLFGSRSAKSLRSSDPLSDPSVSNPDLTDSESYASASPSSSSIARRKKPILRLSSLDETSSTSTFDRRRERGMSPDADCNFASSPDSWRRTPRTSHARVPASPARSQLASGIGFCLSPLVRPSPCRHWKGKAVGFEPGPQIKPQLSAAASLRANRSRKLTDLGKFDHSR